MLAKKVACVYELSTVMREGNHCIRVVANRTGLSQHVIRVWEKRYGAVTPERTDTNRRLYSEEEIERLSLMRLATAAGHSISLIAKLPSDRLRALVAQSAPLAQAVPHRPVLGDRAGRFVASALAAVGEFDGKALEAALNRALVAFGNQGLLRKVIGPLAERIGELWRKGDLTAAHEHFLSAALKVFLGRLNTPSAISAAAPRLVVATPPGQLHELGAAMVATEAANLGWRVVYLGANLPVAEIAGAAIQSDAAAVALSLVYPEDDTGLAAELLALRRLLPDSTKIVAGGRAALTYRSALLQIGASITGDLDELAEWLDASRRSSNRASDRPSQ